MIRTKSAKFQIRNNQYKHRDFLWLIPPFPKKGDYEWAIRMTIDKWFVMTLYPRIEDSGSGSSGLCIAAGDLGNMDNRCSDCPVKMKTGAPNCENTPFALLVNATTWDEFADIYKQMLSFLRGLYLDLYGMDYEPEMFEE